VSEVIFDRELAAALKAVETERRGILRSVVARACAAGALDGEVELLLDVLFGAAYFQLLVRQMPPEEDLQRRVAGLLWRKA
jgi:hypothetical protein